jgi:hypothetical protein
MYDIFIILFIFTSFKGKDKTYFIDNYNMEFIIILIFGFLRSIISLYSYINLKIKTKN